MTPRACLWDCVSALLLESLLVSALVYGSEYRLAFATELTWAFEMECYLEFELEC